MLIVTKGTIHLNKDNIVNLNITNFVKATNVPRLRRIQMGM